MSRAEIRRAKKENDKKQKVFTMTKEEVDKLRIQEFERARKILMQKNAELAEEILLMMLVIPTNILVSDYWPKTAKKRIPYFVEQCISLYEAWEMGVVDMQQMIDLTEEYSGIRLIREGTATARTVEERIKKGKHV